MPLVPHVSCCAEIHCLPLTQDSASDKGACLLVNRELKECLSWTTQDTKPKNAKILVRALKDCELHTYEGMLGYCTKDKGMPHYQVIMHNVTEDELKRGAELYVQFGAGESTHSSCLSLIDLILTYTCFRQAEAPHRD
jgi:hypothetical protein